MVAESWLLEAEGLSKRFGGLQAVQDVQLQVAAGQITGLIGPNGAGKSTLFALLANFLKPDAGTVHFRGRRTDPLPPYQLAQLGLVRTFQTARSLSRLTVLENMLLGAQQQHGERFWQVWLQPQVIRQQERELRDRALTLLEEVGLAAKAQDYAGSLSGGQRKLLEMARALMASPQLVLLDEPAAGVNPALIETLCEHIQTWNQQGISFLIIEHNMDVIMSLCDRIWVLAEGRNLVDGPPATIQHNEQVLAAYLGLESA